MPSLTDRAKLICQLDFVLKILIIDGKENTKDFIEMMEIRCGLGEMRYLNEREAIPKTKAMQDMLFYYPDKEFVQIVRMSKQAFVKTVARIEQHPVFQQNGEYSRHCQASVWVQLMVTMGRLGCDGNGASVGRNARSDGVSYGSVLKYSERVFIALLSLQDEVIKWPDAAERAATSRRFATDHGLPGAIGVVDGTPVNFFQRPHVDGETFWTRKQRYSMNVQLVCDDRRKIIYYVLGWPGSVYIYIYDATVFGQSDLFKDPHAYFSALEYLLGDSGYCGTWFICTPYRQPAASIPHNEVYNTLFSSARQVIEHVNGIIKNRFGSLKNIRIEIKKAKDFETFNNWILVCLILHNLLLSFDDE
jgi:hypothetical protein